MANILTTISYYDLMTTCAKLTEAKAQNVYNNKTLLEENWVNSTEWTQGEALRASFDVHEIENASNNKPTGSKDGAPYKRYNRFISASETIDGSFPFNVPSIVTRINSKDFDVEADRVAGYFTGTGTLYGQYYETSGNENKYGVACRGDYFVLRKTLNGTITTITNSTFNTSNSLISNVKKIGYSDALYEDYTTGGQTYNGHYKRYDNATSEIHNFASLFDHIFYSLSTNAGCLAKTDVTLTTNFLLFKNQADCDYYLQTGDASKAIKPIEETGEEDEKFLYCITKENNAPIKDGQGVTSEHDIKINYDKSVEGYGGTRPVGGWIVDNSPYNIKLKTNPNSTITKTQINVHDGEGWIETDFADVENPSWTYTELIQGQGGNYYFGIIRTNIPIFETEQQVNDYFNGILSANSSLNGGGNYHGKPNGTGNKKIESLFNNVYAPTVLSKCLICSFATLSEIASILFQPEITTLKELTEAMAMFGENPISFISDAFMLPINPRPFCETTMTSNMGFGSYYHSLSASYEEAVVTNKMLTMFNTYIDGAFGDWRDYMAQYFLYLPYVGVTGIDIDKYLYHDMECKVSFDVRTGSIKYYLLSDGVMIDTFEGSVRVSMPLCGSDTYTSAMNKLSGASSVISATVGSVSSATSGDIVGSIGSAINLTQSTSKMVESSPKMTTGNFSNSLAFNDQLDAYLIIAQQEFEYPSQMISKYGLPNNDVATIGTYHGFLQCDSIRLNTTATETEQNEIIALCSNGIIV